MVRWVIQNNLSAEGGDFHKMAKACESKFDTFEEAEVACIKKLIEVVK